MALTNTTGQALDEAKRLTIGDQILEMAAELAARAEHMVHDVDVTLASVSTPSDPETDKGGILEGTWPPMYQELRNYFRRIERSIEQVHVSLSRTELP